MAKRKSSAPDDLTLASINVGSEPKARKRKAEAPIVIIDRWQAVADECPCLVSADGHKSNRARVHITRQTPHTTAQAGESTASDGIVLCVPKAEIAPPWRTTDAYRLAELAGV